MSDIVVSFLLPTRGRPERLVQSLQSLASTASDPKSYEVVMRADADDLPTIEVAAATQQPLIVGDRGAGYLDLHRFVNACAEQSRGEFLFLWNDDAVMLTQGWDDVLRQRLSDPPRVYQPSSPGHGRNIFPVVRRSVYEAMGRFSESALNDFYMSTMAKRAGIETGIGIQIRHDHPFQGGNVHDQTYLDAVAANVICKHDDKDARIMACLQEDVDKVKALLEKTGK